jgi:hypothetical protein
LRVNIARNSLPHILAALLLTAMTPVVFSLTSLNAELSAQPLEIYLPLTGTLLLTPLFLPEQDETIRDVVRMRRTSYLSICALRLGYLLLCLLLMFAAVLLLMRHGECTVGMKQLGSGIANAVFLGSIGIFFSAVSNNVIIGYMASLFYFVINFFGRKQLGVFYLFKFTTNADISKIWVIEGTVLLLLLTYAYLRIIKKT